MPVVSTNRSRLAISRKSGKSVLLVATILALLCFAAACASDAAGDPAPEGPGLGASDTVNTAGAPGTVPGDGTATAQTSSPMDPAADTGAVGAGGPTADAGGMSPVGMLDAGAMTPDVDGMIPDPSDGEMWNDGSAVPMDGPDNDAACTASMPASASASGSGPHGVVIETNSDPGISEGTIFRPEDLGGQERYPIFIWGEGGCAQQGLSNQSANAEIASHGYFVIADGTPSGGGGNRALGGAGAGDPMIKYIDWAIAENNKPCSAYYHSLDISKIATNGFSCGGLMAQGTAGDPRVTTVMINSSGGFSANQNYYSATHGPTFIVLGGPSDIAYENGKRDYENLAKLSYPVMLFSKDIGHGGDLFRPDGGDFTRLNLAWINWWLKGDEGATGKGFLVGDGCSLCTDSSWETNSANVP